MLGHGALVVEQACAQVGKELVADLAQLARPLLASVELPERRFQVLGGRDLDPRVLEDPEELVLVAAQGGPVLVDPALRLGRERRILISPAVQV